VQHDNCHLSAYNHSNYKILTIYFMGIVILL